MAVISPYLSSSSKFGAFMDSPPPYQVDEPTSNRSSAASDSLAPPPSPYPQHVDPSPTDSNGTENTDIEEDVQDQVGDNLSDAVIQSSRPQSRESLTKLDTTVASRSRANSDEAPPSVIHAPADFKELTSPEQIGPFRHAGRDTKRLDELLALAIQACWDLSDIFRESWSHLRPDRSTPRPGQVGFSSSVSQHSTGPSERAPSSLSSEYHDAPLPPETPITIFDDAITASSPESVTVPNILVLGPAAPASSGGSTRGAKHHDRWSSNASTLSDYSESADSQRTSSTARANSDGKHLLRLRCLILKAACNVGFSRTSNQSLASFAKKLPGQSFGSQSWQVRLLEQYKRLVIVDQSLRSVASLSGRSLTAVEVAKAVMWLSRNEEWVWLQDLYLIVFSFGVEEAEVRGGFFQI
ncbi:hypothetical protein KCU65_g7389, partial [Aureobasidium melanogenum]